MPKLSLPSVSAPPDEPYATWHARLQPLMYMHSFVPLHHVGYGLPPFGVDIDGVLKGDPNADSDRAQRRHYLDAFEQILDLFVEFGVRHRRHPEFEVSGRVERGPQLLTGKLLEPDQLIPECKVKFRLSLEEANRHD